MKLAVGFPWSSPFVWTGFAETMLNLERPRAVRLPLGALEPLETKFFRGAGWCPARRHAHLCEQALAWGADLICIVGADQVHPADLLPRLLARWEAGCEVIAALVPARGYIGWQDMKPFQRMAWRLKRTPLALGARAETPNDYEPIDPAAGELQEINFIGSGVLLFPADALRLLKLPWFSERFNPETMAREASMDTLFVWRLQQEAGLRVWVDTTIKVTHLHPMPIDETFADRFPDWAEPGAGPADLCVFPPESRVA